VRFPNPAVGWKVGQIDAGIRPALFGAGIVKLLVQISA
jgi:hypothetical protein